MLSWANRFNIFCFMDNNGYAIAPHRYECLLAAGGGDFVDAAQGATLSDLNAFLQTKAWTFGHLAYEAGYAFYDLKADKPDPIGFPSFYFFRPQYVLVLKGTELKIEGPDADAIYRQILDQPVSPAVAGAPITFGQRMSREGYLEKIRQLQQHIQRGDCYEVNFCHEFFAEDVSVDPVSVFRRLNELSPNPFSVFYRLQDRYLVCASPERFLFREGAKIFSQPIKGTAKRIPGLEEEDFRQAKALWASAKEQSENVMIVDLVRNDLSKVCREGSVRVEELFGIYSFPQVHQMISTISGRLEEGTGVGAILEATFPMGSMTGAPKKRVMELIHGYEPSARGIFSGSVGYINPTGDFDFNVVIRSIMYNAASRYLSYQVGSGITFYSEAEREWEECLVKGEAIKKVLTT